MSAKDLLEQLNALNIEVNQLENQLKDLSVKSYNYESDGVQGSSKTIPYAKHSITIGGYCRSKGAQRQIDKLGQTYADKLERLYAERVEAERILDGITDSKARAIIRYRYIEGLTWQEVANKLGGDNTEDSTRKYAERYLEKVC